MTTAYATTAAIDHARLYDEFLSREEDSDGTIVLHHGRVKKPGKQIASFSAVELEAVVLSMNIANVELKREGVVTMKLEMDEKELFHTPLHLVRPERSH